jgi:hypothetical protein
MYNCTECTAVLTAVSSLIIIAATTTTTVDL